MQQVEGLLERCIQQLEAEHQTHAEHTQHPLDASEAEPDPGHDHDHKRENVNAHVALAPDGKHESVPSVAKAAQ